MRTVTKASGLLLSETIPDNFILFCENTYPGRMHKIADKRAKSKNFLIAFSFLLVFSRLKYKVNEFFRSLKIYLMKGGK
jgi:hypothetical protein